MAFAIGRSTSTETANNREDVSGNEPASFRYFNPGAQYPSTEASKFGQLGYGIIGGGHKIAKFPSAVNGAASNFDLLFRNYVGMSIGAAGKKWTGSNGFGVPGYDSDGILTSAMLTDPSAAVELLKAIAGRESGRGNNLTELQWQQAHSMFRMGSANAYLDSLPDEPAIEMPAGSKTGAGLLRRAREHIGEKYENILVPKDRADWKGPWDCAEFVSWVVYQEAQLLYGCTDDNSPPGHAEAYTGAWKTDAERLGKRVTVEQAAGTVGGVLLRFPPAPGKMGHIAICDGRGGTVEAKGRRYGVVADTASGRDWDVGILIPGIDYETSGSVAVVPPSSVYKVGAPNMDSEIVLEIQQALQRKGLSVVTLSSSFDRQTQLAVAKFQEAEGLVVDGAVGPETAAALGVSLTSHGSAIIAPKPAENEHPALSGASLLVFLQQILTKDNSMATDGINSNQNGDAVRLLLLALLQSALSGKPLDGSVLLSGLLAGTSGATAIPGSPVSQGKEQNPAGDLISLVLPLLYDKITGTTTPAKVDHPQQPLQPALSRPSVQLSVAGMALTSILQVLGAVGTPFGLGALPTAAGTLATIIPLVVGAFGATNGFSSLLSGLRKLAGGISVAGSTGR